MSLEHHAHDGMTDTNPETPDDRLAAFGQRLDAEPDLAAIRALLMEFPDAEAYLVGGIVRDAAIGRAAKDYDFVIRGVSADALKGFLHTRGTMNLVGRNFGVYKFSPFAEAEEDKQSAGPLAPHSTSDGVIDIALPRTEHGEGTGGYRDFDVQANPDLRIEDDLARRDFTINAMAWDLRNRMLIDPFGGRVDLEAKVIRAVRDPNERFAEDRSRMLRCLRFAAQLGFTIEPETMDAIRELMPKINEQRPARKAHEQMTLLASAMEYVTPRETIAKELIKSFTADPARSMDLWDDAGAIAELMPEALAMKGCAQPELYHSEGDVWTHTRLALTQLSSPEYRQEFDDEPPSALVALGVFFHDFGKPPTQKTPERDGTDRIRFDGHDKVGGEMVRNIAERLTLAAPFPNGHPLHVDAETLGLVVDHHLLLLNDPGTMKNATIEKYFFNPAKPGDALQRVSFCDGSAAVPLGGESPDLAHFRALRTRIAELGTFIAERNRLPKPVIDGSTIMAHFDLKPGKHIGELIAALREEQLTRLQANTAMTPEDALTFLERVRKNTST